MIDWLFVMSAGTMSRTCGWLPSTMTHVTEPSILTSGSSRREGELSEIVGPHVISADCHLAKVTATLPRLLRG